MVHDHGVTHAVATAHVQRTVLGCRTCRYTIHVIDTDPNSMSAHGWLEDVSKVQKYEMSDADYQKRDNTYRKFKEQKQEVNICLLVLPLIFGIAPAFLKPYLPHECAGRS